MLEFVGFWAANSFKRPVSVLILTVVMTLAAYTPTKIGTVSCINDQPGLPRSMSVQSGGDSLAVFSGSLASCGLLAGVGVAVPEAGAGVAVVEGEGVDTPTNAYNCTCYARRAAARSALP